MSLYHEAAKILDSTRTERSSIKSLVYSKKGWRSDPKTLFALSTEAAKWSEVLAEVVERSGVLRIEKTLSPTLALVLIHDLFLSKRGVALPSCHGLNASISRHKARLSAELTKSRLKRGFATLDALRASINSKQITTAEGDGTRDGTAHPRWVRVNTLRTTVEDQLKTTFADYAQGSTLAGVTGRVSQDSKVFHVDEHIPNLIAIPLSIDITATKSYRSGELILQDKASCFPAYLLDPKAGSSVIDACAAPGNKTTHLAAILSEKASEDGGAAEGKIIACEKDAVRSQTLEKMVKLADGEGIIKVKAQQDFMKLKPERAEFAAVTALLLDPSCSGSGIVGRDEGGITVHLPSREADDAQQAARKGKKRKRDTETAKPSAPRPDHLAKASPTAEDTALEEETPTESVDSDKLQSRLANLSAFQLRLLERAMAFPAARRITYSTCSIHAEENEHVVIKALLSQVARERGWRIMRRGEQVDGLGNWHRRGSKEASLKAVEDARDDVEGLSVAEIAEGCIRCDKGNEEGTMGFFVAGFVREGRSPDSTEHGNNSRGPLVVSDEDDEEEEEAEEEWNGFGDEA